LERRWVSVRTVSEYLGIHEITARRLIDRGVIPATKIGGSIRVDMKKLDEILESKERINGA
jgi:excisionase family DNA binding protein